MPCIESRKLVRTGPWLSLAAVALLSACGSPSPSPSPITAPTVAPPAPGSPPGPAAPADRPTLAPAQAARSWDDFKRQAALRMVAANPDLAYEGPVPDPLLAIPVLEIELDAAGGVRHISVLRYPRQAKDTTQLAIDAVRRAAPFGPMTFLPRPWKFAEVFLFNDDRRFKPRTLDE